MYGSLATSMIVFNASSCLLFLRDVPARYLLRLGQGEQELATDLDFSRQGRVNAMPCTWVRPCLVKWRGWLDLFNCLRM